MLEETLERLQARLQELENPGAARPVLLADPYSIRGPAGPHELSRSEEASPVNWWDCEEPPAQMRDMLYVLYGPFCAHLSIEFNPNRVNLFLPYAPILGFSLSPARFNASLALQREDISRPSPCLLNAVILWALRISDMPEFLEYEDLYIERTVVALQERVSSCVAVAYSDVRTHHYYSSSR